MCTQTNLAPVRSLCYSTVLWHFWSLQAGHLPVPNVPISANVPPSAIRQASLDVVPVENRNANVSSEITDKQRAQISKYVMK